ncbi:hypothetical protein [Pedobacter sp. L105]|uniref:hypothetical protein n=1 Tax=Pedobacter sp. L105 TaxID=1641871 RepID=UPI00131C3E49|nr:hypothetical protein [Pedobacter sp. L105]
MEYKVVPFVAVINQQKETTKVVADQLEQLIQKFHAEGWEYLRLESVSTYVQPESGCFGGGTPGRMTAHQMVVFTKDY